MEGDERAQVGGEIERAIRNMSGLVRRKTTVDGKTVYLDPIHDLIRDSQSAEEFRAWVIDRMDLGNRTITEIWYESGTRKKSSRMAA